MSRLNAVPVTTISVIFPFTLVFAKIKLAFNMNNKMFISQLLKGGGLSRTDIITSISILATFVSNVFVVAFYGLFVRQVLYCVNTSSTDVGVTVKCKHLFAIYYTVKIFGITSTGVFISRKTSGISTATVVANTIIGVKLIPLFVCVFNLKIGKSTCTGVTSRLVATLVCY